MSPSLNVTFGGIVTLLLPPFDVTFSILQKAYLFRARLYSHAAISRQSINRRSKQPDLFVVYKKNIFDKILKAPIKRGKGLPISNNHVNVTVSGL